MDTPNLLQLGEKREKPPDLLNGEKVASCLKDGEAEEDMYTLDSLGHEKKKGIKDGPV